MLNYQKAILIVSWVQSSTINICIYVKLLFPDVQADFRKGKGTRDQIANIRRISKELESSRKTSISALLTMPKPLTVWITINCGKFFKRWDYHTT